MTGIDPRWLIGAALLLVFVLLLLGLRAGWRAKSRRQADIPPPPAASVVTGDVVERLDDVHYVATTLDERPLERIVDGPLAFRGRCLLEIAEDGVRVTIRGTEPFSIPAAAIDEVGARTTTIDRTVERDGLTSISWRLGAATEIEVPVHTSFRIVDRGERERIATALARIDDATTTPTEESS